MDEIRKAKKERKRAESFHADQPRKSRARDKSKEKPNIKVEKDEDSKKAKRKEKNLKGEKRLKAADATEQALLSGSGSRRDQSTGSDKDSDSSVGVTSKAIAQAGKRSDIRKLNDISSDEEASKDSADKGTPIDPADTSADKGTPTDSADTSSAEKGIPMDSAYTSADKGIPVDSADTEQSKKSSDTEENLDDTLKVSDSDHSHALSPSRENSKSRSPTPDRKSAHSSRKRHHRSTSSSSMSSSSESSSESSSSESSSSSSESSSESEEERRKKKKKNKKKHKSSSKKSRKRRKSSKRHRSSSSERAPKKIKRNLNVFPGENFKWKEGDPDVVRVHADYPVFIKRGDLEDSLNQARSPQTFIKLLVGHVFTLDALKGSTAQGFPSRNRGLRNIRQKDVLPRIDPEGRKAIMRRAEDLESERKSWRPKIGTTSMNQAFTQAVGNYF